MLAKLGPGGLGGEGQTNLVAERPVKCVQLSDETESG